MNFAGGYAFYNTIGGFVNPTHNTVTCIYIYIIYIHFLIRRSLSLARVYSGRPATFRYSSLRVRAPYPVCEDGGAV